MKWNEVALKFSNMFHVSESLTNNYIKKQSITSWLYFSSEKKHQRWNYWNWFLKSNSSKILNRKWLRFITFCFPCCLWFHRKIFYAFYYINLFNILEHWHLFYEAKTTFVKSLLLLILTVYSKDITQRTLWSTYIHSL